MRAVVDLRNSLSMFIVKPRQHFINMEVSGWRRWNNKVKFLWCFWGFLGAEGLATRNSGWISKHEYSNDLCFWIFDIFIWCFWYSCVLFSFFKSLLNTDYLRINFGRSNFIIKMFNIAHPTVIVRPIYIHQFPEILHHWITSLLHSSYSISRQCLQSKIKNSDENLFNDAIPPTCTIYMSP